MTLHRASGAALLLALLLQLTLPGWSTGCAMRDGSPPTQSASGQMMHDMAPTTTPASGRCGDAGGSGGDCHMPWSSGQCTAMTSCTPTAMPAMVISAQIAAPSIATDVPAPRRLLSGPTAAPELPPPRL